MDVEIREARISDIEPLYLLWDELHGSHYIYDEDFYKLKGDLNPDDVKKFLEKEIKDIYAILLLAIFNGGIIGFIHAKFLKRPPIYRYRNVIQVSMIGVTKKYQDMGVGSTLFQALENDVEEENMYISLSVDVDNKAIGLYERLGFKKRHLKMYKKY